MFHDPPKPPSSTGLPAGRASPHPAGGRQELPTPLPAPPRAPGRLGTLICSPFLLPGYNYTSLGSSGNTSFFPQASLGIARGTAKLIQHAPGFVLPPRRFLLLGSPGTALAQLWHRPSTAHCHFCHFPSWPWPLPLGQGLLVAAARARREMKEEGAWDDSIGQCEPCLLLFALR